MHACMYVCMHACMYVCMYIMCVHNIHANIYRMYVYMQSYIYISKMCMHAACMYCVCKDVCMYTYTRVYIHTYVCILYGIISPSSHASAPNPQLFPLPFQGIHGGFPQLEPGFYQVHNNLGFQKHEKQRCIHNC